MASHPRIVARTATLSVLLACFVLTGCHSSTKNSAPTIVFTKIPPAAQVGQERLDTISGRVSGARAGQRIVSYAKTDGRWRVYLQSGQPFTHIETDGVWNTSIQLGTQYAALLVDPTYNPPEQTESLPIVGDGVVARAVVNGEGPAPVLPSPKILNFSGYEWTTSTGPIFRAGSRNFFDPANVWTDERGALHLRISGSPGKWTAAELKLTRSLGYGTYRFQVRDVSHLKTSAHSFRWEPGQVAFFTVAGAGNTGDGRAINRHVFTSGVPSPEGQSVRIASYVFHQGQIPLKSET